MALSEAIGALAPAEISPDFLSGLSSGAWLAATTETIPFVCMDGRPAETGLPEGPKAAGGTISLWIGATLAGETTLPLDIFAEHLSQNGTPVGGHTGPAHAVDQAGCAAADHLSDILAILTSNPIAVRKMISSWGLDETVVDQEMLSIAQSFVCPSGMNLIEGIRENGHLVTLIGPHREEAAVVNLRPGTSTSDAGRQTFHIDAWTFPRLGSPRYAAGVAAFNAAALLRLCSPNMPYIEIT